MPRAFLKSSGQTTPADSVLANFAFLSRTDNRQLGGTAPSAYKGQMAQNWEEILAAALCPRTLFDDKYQTFLEERSAILSAKAEELCS